MVHLLPPVRATTLEFHAKHVAVVTAVHVSVLTLQKTEV